MQSKQLFEKAKHIIPGGVNSPVRSFKAVDGDPPFIRCGYGSKIEDVDGNIYIDYCCSWGPLILGHAHPDIVRAIHKTSEDGTSFGAPSPLEVEMAQVLTEAFPSIHMVRMVNSGTEATMSALRLARSYTGRKKVVKFSGCYHGHVDGLLVAAGSGASTLAIPTSKGIPDSVFADTFVLPFNDQDACRDLFSKNGDDIAAVIVEPIPGNMGVIPPKQEYLKELRQITAQYESLLIFDEVITGFRVAWGGAQTIFEISPDITCLGKIIGGGLPVGAYGGKRQIMEQVAPIGEMYQAGTLSGNPLAMVAGLATLKCLRNGNGYVKLDNMGKWLCESIMPLAEKHSIPIEIQRIGSMFTIFFSDIPLACYDDVTKCNQEAFKIFFRAMLQEGIYLPPSQFEAAFISLSHTRDDIERTVEAVERAFSTIR
jgi:glutamate-1-semialdehyde 2,1-aminomutase